MSDLEKCAVIATKICDNFAAVCNNVIRDEDKSQNKDKFTDVASSIIAGAIQFTVKSMIIGGFSKENVVEAISAAYDHADKHDVDVHKARLLRAVIETMGSTRVQ